MSDSKSLIIENAEIVWKRIVEAAIRSNRDPKEIKLVAVSKKQPVQKMLEYQQICSKYNCTAIFGENYVQEFETKNAQIAQPYSAHLIGPLQSNKAKLAVQLFDVIESVHKPETAEAINKAAQKLGKQQEIFLQINISDDLNKSGFQQRDIFNFVSELETYANLKCTGLMTITELYADPELARSDFAQLRNLRDEIQLRFAGKVDIRHLSMGMSQDFEIAIEEGATLVRVGTALFGARA